MSRHHAAERRATRSTTPGSASVPATGSGAGYCHTALGRRYRYAGCECEIISNPYGWHIYLLVRTGPHRGSLYSLSMLHDAHLLQPLTED